MNQAEKKCGLMNIHKADYQKEGKNEEGNIQKSKLALMKGS